MAMQQLSYTANLIRFASEEVSNNYSHLLGILIEQAFQSCLIVKLPCDIVKVKLTDLLIGLWTVSLSRPASLQSSGVLGTVVARNCGFIRNLLSLLKMNRLIL